MPRLTLPEEEIDIYKDGFETHKNLLDRSEEGRRLSHLVTTIDDPVTIAVDGAWGAGQKPLPEMLGWRATSQRHHRPKRNRGLYTSTQFAHDYLERSARGPHRRTD